MENLEKGPLPERFVLIVSYQEGEYEYGKNCSLKSLVTVLKDSRRRYWMGYVDEGEFPEKGDALWEKIVLVMPERKISFVPPYNVGAIQFKGIQYPYGKDGQVDWERKTVGEKPKLSREQLVYKILRLVFDELRKINKINLSEAWLREFILNKEIYVSDEVKIRRSYVFYNHGRNIVDGLMSDSTRPDDLAKTISDRALDDFLSSTLHNFDCPDYVMQSVPASEVERVGLKKDICPIEILGVSDLWKEFKERFGAT